MDESITERFPGARVPERTLLTRGVEGFEWRRRGHKAKTLSGRSGVHRSSTCLAVDRDRGPMAEEGRNANWNRRRQKAFESAGSDGLLRGCAAAHRETHYCHPGGSEPYFRGPQSGALEQKYSIVNFCRVGTFIQKTLAHRAVAITIGDNSSP